MLDNDQHDGREGDDPQEGVAELGACREIRRPVSGIDKAYGDE